MNSSALVSLHGVAALAHFAQFLASLALVINDNGSTWPIISRGFQDTVNTWKYNLAYLVPLFPALSSVNHAVAYMAGPWYDRVLQSRVNKLRWVEYSVSAGIMLWIISTLSGIIEIRSLVTIALLNAALQYVGYSIEKAKAENTNNVKQLLLIGISVHVAIWVQIFISFYTVINESKNKAPAGVYTIIMVMFVLFTSFGVWSALWVFDKVASFEILEMGYLILSLVAKTFLTWMVYFGVLVPEERYETS